MPALPSHHLHNAETASSFHSLDLWVASSVLVSNHVFDVVHEVIDFLLPIAVQVHILGMGPCHFCDGLDPCHFT